MRRAGAEGGCAGHGGQLYTSGVGGPMSRGGGVVIVIASPPMKAWNSLFALALTLGLASVGVAACSGGDSTATASTSTGGGSSTSASGTGGAGTSGTGGAASTGTGGAGGGSTSASTSTTASSSASTSGSGGMAAFSLTSTGFSEGMVIPVKYACKPAGMDVSPDLSWTTGPSGTLSYAVVLTDKTNNLIHWVIWDIPGGTAALPENVQKKANPAVPAGSQQVKSFDNSTFGYRGPCPPNTHTYEFAVFALDVATLPNVTTASSRMQVKAEILNHDLGSATLTGTYTP